MKSRATELLGEHPWLYTLIRVVIAVITICCSYCYCSTNRRNKSDLNDKLHQRSTDSECPDAKEETQEMPEYALKNLLGRGIDICRFDPKDIMTSMTPSFMLEPKKALACIFPSQEVFYSSHLLCRQRSEQLNDEFRVNLSKSLEIDPFKIDFEVGIGKRTSTTKGEERKLQVEKIHKSTARFLPETWEYLSLALGVNQGQPDMGDNTVKAKVATVVECNKVQSKLDSYAKECTSMKACEKILENVQTRATHFISAVHLGGMAIHESSAKKGSEIKRTPFKVSVQSSSASVETAPDASANSACDEEESRKDRWYFLDPRVEFCGRETIIKDGHERIIGVELKPITVLAKDGWQENLKTVLDRYIDQSFKMQQGKKHTDSIGIFSLQIGQYWLNVDERLESVRATRDERQASKFHFWRYKTDTEMITIQFHSNTNEVRFLSLPGSNKPIKLDRVVSEMSLFRLCHVDTVKAVCLAAEPVLHGHYLIYRKERGRLWGWNYIFLAADTDIDRSGVTGKYYRTKATVLTQFLIKSSNDTQNATVMTIMQ
jgi:hypothetical protein